MTDKIPFEMPTSKMALKVATCLVGLGAMSGLAVAQSGDCSPIVTKSGLRLPSGCTTVGAQPTTIPSSSLGTRTVLAPSSIGSGSIEGVVLQPTTTSSGEAPVEGELSLDPAETAEQADPIAAIEPIATAPLTSDFVAFSLGGGAAMMGSSFKYNGVGGGSSTDTFGANLTQGEAIYGLNGGLDARFGSFFARGSGFYGFGSDSWADPKTTFTRADGSSVAKVAGATINASGSLIRGGIAGGYVFDLGQGVGLDAGPSLVFVNQQVTLTSDDGTLKLDDSRTATTTAVGLMGGVSIAPQPDADFAIWGNAAVHGLYGFGGYTLSQTVNGGTALTQADIVSPNISSGQKITFMGESNINAGYKLDNGLHIGGGVYVNYLNDMAIIEDYNLTSMSLLDFGARVSVSLGF